MPHIFEKYENDDVLKLIRENPVAWIVPEDQRTFPALLPMLVECDADGAPTSLLGHVPKHHALAEAFKARPSARFLFLGPHGYISPEHLSDKNWAPTWNYASVQIDGDVALDDSLTDEALETLVAHMEAGRADPWTVAHLGERYDSLRRRVIGFRAQITAIRARFKLGQDESAGAFDEILAGLPAPDLARWMRAFRRRQ